MPRPPVSIQLSLADPFTTPDFTEIAPLVQSLTGGGRGKQKLGKQKEEMGGEG